MIGNRFRLGPTIGRLHLEGVLESIRLKIKNDTHIMKDIYQVISFENSFIERGDSGSGVFVQHGGELICIGIALSTDDTGMLGYVTPIDSVFKVLGDGYKLKQFNCESLCTTRIQQKPMTSKLNH